MKKNNTQLLQLKFFSTKIKPKEIIDSKKFIQVIQKQKKNLYNKDFLLGNMTFNVIYFCISRRELNNAAAHIPLILKINTYLIANTYNLFLLNISINKIFKLVKFTDFLLKKKFFVKFNFLLKENFI